MAHKKRKAEWEDKMKMFLQDRMDPLARSFKPAKVGKNEDFKRGQAITSALPLAFQPKMEPASEPTRQADPKGKVFQSQSPSQGDPKTPPLTVTVKTDTPSATGGSQTRNKTVKNPDWLLEDTPGMGDSCDDNPMGDADSDMGDNPNANAAQDEEAAPAPKEREIDLNMLSRDQRRFVDLVLNEKRNVFLTGCAGCGKSLAVLALCQELRRAKRIFAVTASTGIAASHLSGTTIYSWMQLRKAEGKLSDLVQMVRNSKTKRERWSTIDVLIIDEISMLDPRILEVLHEVATAVRQNSKPFGGIQIVLCGDFAQLPPVQSSTSVDFCFEHDLWQHGEFETVNLTHVFRQEDAEFVAFLRRVRDNRMTDADFAFLDSKVGKPIMAHVYPELLEMKTPYDAVSDKFDIVDTALYSTNADVDKENEREMKKLQPNEQMHVRYSYRTARVRENAKNKAEFDAFITQQKEKGPARPEVVVCTGAQVMLVANIDVANHKVNGCCGVVVGFSKPVKVPGYPCQPYPVVRFRNGDVMPILPYTWTHGDPKGAHCDYIQVPLKLSWSITVHKSQGMTLDRAYIKLAGIFAAGQAYTALSRVRRPDGLILEGKVDRSAFKYHPKVLDLYQALSSSETKTTETKTLPAKPSEPVSHASDDDDDVAVLSRKYHEEKSQTKPKRSKRTRQDEDEEEDDETEKPKKKRSKRQEKKEDDDDDEQEEETRAKSSKKGKKQGIQTQNQVYELRRDGGR